MSDWASRIERDSVSPEKTKIILVDDEPAIIESKKALVDAGMASAWQGWEILYATSAEEALQLFARNSDVTHIVTDRSVNTGGVHILEQVTKHIKDHPEEQRAFKGAVIYSWMLGDDPQRPLVIEGLNIVRVPNEQPGSYERLGVAAKPEVEPIPFNPRDPFAGLPGVESDPWYAKIVGAVRRVDEMAASRTPT